MRNLFKNLFATGLMLTALATPSLGRAVADGEAPASSPASTPAATQPASGGDHGIDIAAGVWMPTLNGNIGASGFTADLRTELGLKASTSPALDLTFGRGLSRFGLGYTSLSSSASSRLTSTLQLNNTTYVTGTTVNSKLNFTSFDASWQPRLIESDKGNLSALLLVKVIDTSASVNAPTLNLSSSSSVTVPAPLIGLSGDVKLGKSVALYGQVGYVGISRVSLLDYRAGVKAMFTPTFGLSADYRYFGISGSDSKSNHVNIRYGGPEIQLRASF
ncbi:MAG: hypothetical protein EB084_05790 [Proteobacteria bacterium]|nr:hypothetical protein [Pseudomonadota bacterium]